MGNVIGESKLDRARPELRRFVLALADAADFDIGISEGERPDARQDSLYARGRTEPGEIVTYAKAGESAHNPDPVDGEFYATDLVPYRNGKADWSDTNGFDFIGSFFHRYQPLEESLGWGGDFKKLVDRPHIEIKNWKAIKAAKAMTVAGVTPKPLGGGILPALALWGIGLSLWKVLS